MKSKPRLLIVEDDADLQRIWKPKFATPSRNYIEAYGIESFEVDTATCGEQALSLLNLALADATPYDVVLLDLGLPQLFADRKPDPRVGLGILRLLQQDLKWACAAIVVQSVHTEVPTFLEVLRSGAADFVPKPSDLEGVYRAVVQAHNQAKTKLENQLNAWRTQQQRRLEAWLFEANTRVGDQMAASVSTGISEILGQTGELERLIEDHFQLSIGRDKDHPICQATNNIRALAERTGRDCANVLESRSRVLRENEMEEIQVGVLLDEVIAGLRSGIFYHRLRFERPDAGTLAIHSFKTDLRMILQEMLFSGITASPEGGAVKLSVEHGNDGLTLDVRIDDEAPRLTSAQRQTIVSGRQTADYSENRDWGLALAQHVALNIGARLSLETLDNGNRVTLHIPLTAYDTAVNH